MRNTLAALLILLPWTATIASAQEEPASGDLVVSNDLWVDDVHVDDDVNVGLEVTAQSVSARAVNASIRVNSDVFTGHDENTVIHRSEAGFEFYADWDQDTSLAQTFRFFNGVTDSDEQVAVLESDGDLLLAGTVFTNQSLDLAESFVRGEELRPGDVVRIAPEDPETVLRATSDGEGAVLGVVSTRPGAVLGGAPFTVRALRETWGPDVAAGFEARRAALEARALEEEPRLAERLEQLRSPEAAAQEKGIDGLGWEGGPNPDARREERFARDLEMAGLARFFEERFVQVALAGRVPVRVDASFGAVRPGDPLAASPVPGVAMKARGPGPMVGTALEGLERGEGTVTMFVHRGWYGGSRDELTGAPAARREAACGTRSVRHAALEAEDEDAASLRERVARLERVVAALAGVESGGAVTAAVDGGTAGRSGR